MHIFNFFTGGYMESDISHDETGYIEEQLKILDEQIEQVNDNPELSDPEKERECKKLDLVKAQLTERDQQEQDRNQSIVHERGNDFFND